MSGHRVFVLIGLLAICSCSQAQSLQNSSWRAFNPSITDTVSLHFSVDSSSVITSTGAVLLLSTFKLSRDIVTFRDVSGLNACDKFPGSYHVRLDTDTLVLVMDEDPCDGRGGTLIAKKWIRKK